MMSRGHGRDLGSRPHRLVTWVCPRCDPHGRLLLPSLLTPHGDHSTVYRLHMSLTMMNKLIISYNTRKSASKHETFTQGWVNVGPPSPTLGQHKTKPLAAKLFKLNFHSLKVVSR